MKRLLLILVLCLSSSIIMKGEQLVATLQSGDATKMFYGYSAAKDAYEEATDGDVITLSKGNFRDFSIEKEITLRGAGAFTEGESTAFKNLNVYADKVVVEGIRITGILFLKGSGQQILRCYLNQIGSTLTTTLSKPNTNDAYIADCAISNDGHACACVNATYKNCTIRYVADVIYADRSATFDHCIVPYSKAYGYYSNCIIHYGNGGNSYTIYIYEPCQLFKTLIYSTSGTIKFEDGVQREDCIVVKFIQEEYNNKFGTDKFPYFFSEEVTTPEGTSFTCGVVDHKEWPAAPRVVESNIAKETDDAGHLKVQVKVSCER